MDWLGSEGFSAIMTCRRDRLPGGVPNYYFHHSKDSSSAASKVARFYNPITAVKISSVRKDPAAPPQLFSRVHVSMQSTGSTNFSSVNSLNSNSNWIKKKERGDAAKGTKRIWGIEMNDARNLYLHSYGQVDTIDSQVGRCCIFQKCFKYWHSPKNHAIAIAVVMAYDMYKECTTESPAHDAWGLDSTEATTMKKNVMNFYYFREKLSRQLLTYSPQKFYCTQEIATFESTLKQPRRSSGGPTRIKKPNSNPMVLCLLANLTTCRRREFKRKVASVEI